MNKKDILTIMGAYIAMFGVIFLGIIWMFLKLITTLFS